MKNAIAAVGMSSWDHLLVCGTYPGPGEYTVVTTELEQAGGTTANTCAALGLLGLRPMFASCVGDDEYGKQVIESLNAAGCDTEAIIVKDQVATDRSHIVISGRAESLDRTIFWIQGARPAAGERFPIDDILANRWVLIDVDDPRLRQFWLDLPAHRSPRTRLIGTMIYLVEMDREDGWSQGLQHDILFGNRREFLTLTGESDLDAAIDWGIDQLPGNACDAIFVSLGHEGSMILRQSGVVRQPAFQMNAVDTTGAGDAFLAGCVWGLLDGCSDEEMLRRGNLIGGLACTELGARAGLPHFDRAVAALTNAEPRSSNG